MKRFFYLALMPSIFVSCFPTSIVTYSPAPSASYYTTTVTTAGSKTPTYVSQVYAKNTDISLHLDLQAVGALFAQSSSVQEFEQLLNSPSYPVSNLDLNSDGYVDYLRVLETVSGYNHVLLIQAVLARDVYQDVATLIVERPGYQDSYMEIIGAPYIYGSNYIVRPKFVNRPLIYANICIGGYRPWQSPWHWDHFPTYYRRPSPVYLNHYQAYVQEYIGGHRYCREISYPTAPHFAGYAEMSRPYQRNDYGTKHPEQSFSSRNANTPRTGVGLGSGSSMVRNAYDIRQNSDASKITTRPSGGSGSQSGNVNLRPSGSSSSYPGNVNLRPSGSSNSQSGNVNSRPSGGSGSSQPGSVITRPSGGSGSSYPGNMNARLSGDSGSSRVKPTSGHSASSIYERPASRSSNSQTTIRSKVSNSGSSNTTVRPSASKRNESQTSEKSDRKSSDSRNNSSSYSRNTNPGRGTR